MIKYTKEMNRTAAKMQVSPSDLFPEFSGRNRKYIVNTVIQLRLEKRDMNKILLFDENGDMTQIRVKSVPMEHISNQYARMLNKIAKIIISKNKKILEQNTDPDGFYILWAADKYFEIRYFTKEEIALYGRIYHILGRGKIKLVTDQVNISGKIANYIAAIAVLGITTGFFILLVNKILNT